MIDEAARNLSRLAPSGSDLKKRLSKAKTSQEKFAVLTPDDVQQYAITPEKLVPETAGQSLESSAKREFKTVLESLVTAGLVSHVLANDALPTYDPEAGATRLATGVREHARYALLGKDGKTPSAPSPDADIPAWHVRDAMAITGGTPISNTAWGVQDGNVAVTPGAATGPETHSAIVAVDPASADDMTYTWRHAFYRTPKVPDEEHVALGGSKARLVNGIIVHDAHSFRYPGDHANCSCAWVFDVN